MDISFKFVQNKVFRLPHVLPQHCITSELHIEKPSKVFSRWNMTKVFRVTEHVCFCIIVHRLRDYQPPHPDLSGGPPSRRGVVPRAGTRSLQSLRQRHPFAFIAAAPTGGGDGDIYERRICTHAHAAAIIVIYNTLDAGVHLLLIFRPDPLKRSCELNTVRWV